MYIYKNETMKKKKERSQGGHFQVTVAPEPYVFANPCPPSMRGVRISELSSVDIRLIMMRMILMIMRMRMIKMTWILWMMIVCLLWIISVSSLACYNHHLLVQLEDAHTGKADLQGGWRYIFKVSRSGSSQSIWMRVRIRRWMRIRMRISFQSEKMTIWGRISFQIERVRIWGRISFKVRIWGRISFQSMWTQIAHMHIRRWTKIYFQREWMYVFMRTSFHSDWLVIWIRFNFKVSFSVFRLVSTLSPSRPKQHYLWDCLVTW